MRIPLPFALTWGYTYVSQRSDLQSSLFLRTKVRKEQTFDVWSLESNLGGDSYLALFTLIRDRRSELGANSVMRFDGNKLKNERKCTPRNDKMTKNVRHTLKNGRKSTSWWAKGDSLGGFITKRNLLVKEMGRLYNGPKGFIEGVFRTREIHNADYYTVHYLCR